MMFAKLSKLYAIDAACYVSNTELILLTKKSGYELNIGQSQGLEVIFNSKVLKPNAVVSSNERGFMEEKKCSSSTLQIL